LITVPKLKRTVDACRFPPLGRRGRTARALRDALYGLIGDYVRLRSAAATLAQE